MKTVRAEQMCYSYSRLATNGLFTQSIHVIQTANKSTRALSVFQGNNSRAQNNEAKYLRTTSSPSRKVCESWYMTDKFEIRIPIRAYKASVAKRIYSYSYSYSC